MSKKIIIIEKDSAIVKVLTGLVEALNYDAQIVYNWKLTADLKIEEVEAVFIDIEMPIIRVDDVVKTFVDTSANGSQLRVPVFFLYTKQESEYYKKWTTLPHTEAIRKPFQLEDIYEHMKDHMDISDEFVYDHPEKIKLGEFTEYSTDFREWLQKFESIIS